MAREIYMQDTSQAHRNTHQPTRISQHQATIRTHGFVQVPKLLEAPERRPALAAVAVIHCELVVLYSSTRKRARVLNSKPGMLANYNREQERSQSTEPKASISGLKWMDQNTAHSSPYHTHRTITTLAQQQVFLTVVLSSVGATR